MYRDKTLWNMALSNGFRPLGSAEEDLIGVCVHLPIQVLRDMQRLQPKHPIMPIFKHMVEQVLHTDMAHMNLLEQDRTLMGVYADRVREVLVPPPPPPPSPGKGEPKEGEGGEGQAPPSEGENDGKKSEAPAAPQPNGNGQGQGEPPPAPPPAPNNGTGEGEGEQDKPDAPSAPQQGTSPSNTPNKPAKKAPATKPKPRTADQLAKELKKGEREQSKMETNLDSIGGSDTNAPDKRLAQRVRSVLEKIMGSFAMEMTPMWSPRKVVSRLQTFRTLNDARKEEEGRPNISMWSDVSPSCQETSLASTSVANSACLNGTLEADMSSIPLSNWDWSVTSYNDSKYYTYRNGKPVDYSLANLNNKKGVNTIKRADNTLSDMGMTSKQYMEQHGFQVHTYSNYDDKAQVIMLAKEMGVRLTPRTKSLGYHTSRAGINVTANNIEQVLPRTSEARSTLLRLMELAVTPLQDSRENIRARKQRQEELLKEIQGKYPNLNKAMYGSNTWIREPNTDGDYYTGSHDLASALLTNIDADYIIYYTDTDGAWRARTMLSLMKPHQKLFMLTYAAMPDMVNKRGKWAVKVPEQSAKASGFGNDNHVQRGGYGRAPVYQQRSGYDNKGRVITETVGLSRPSFAFSPKAPFDVGYIPHWLGAGADDPNTVNLFAEIAMSPNAQQFTLIPNVTDVDGYVKALEMIASPDRMHLARAGAANMVQEIENNRARWNAVGHPLGGY